MDFSHSIRRRRQHASEFKQGLVALCQPGISVSAVALAHGVNANLLRRWIKQFSGVQPSQVIMTLAKLVPVQVDMPPDKPANDAIKISIKKRRAKMFAPMAQKNNRQAMLGESRRLWSGRCCGFPCSEGLHRCNGGGRMPWISRCSRDARRTNRRAGAFCKRFVRRLATLLTMP